VSREPYYEDSHVQIYHGDCREVLPHLDPVETCITDPPYGLSFMGKDWDRGVPGVHFWELIRAALLPGATCMAFGGTRTFHRLTCAIEDAGFEIRDCMAWMYGSGFPKSLDVSKAIDKAAGVEREVTGERMGDVGIQGGNFAGRTERGVIVQRDAPATEAAKLWHGWGSALKPAWEPIILAMNPLDGTFAENALEHGVAGLNVDGGRIGTEVTTTIRSGHSGDHGKYGRDDRTFTRENPPGRWPANVALDEEAARMLDEQSGDAGGGFGVSGGTPDNGSHAYGNSFPRGNRAVVGYGDSGGASRFFYTAKASRADRGEGNDHPTVKPQDLLRWLSVLTKTPTGGTVLDPFMGSGSMMLAAKETGRKAIGIEIEEKYCEIAAERCSQEVLAL
jgi:hypothetical protein